MRSLPSSLIQAAAGLDHETGPVLAARVLASPRHCAVSAGHLFRLSERVAPVDGNGNGTELGVDGTAAEALFACNGQGTPQRGVNGASGGSLAHEIAVTGIGT